MLDATCSNQETIACARVQLRLIWREEPCHWLTGLNVHIVKPSQCNEKKKNINKTDKTI